MKKLLAIFLVFAMCFSLCACGEKSESGAQTPSVVETLPYEETLFDQLRVGDPLSKAEDIFGMPTSSKDSYDYNIYYKYSSIEIYGLKFEPYVVTDDSNNVNEYGYTYLSDVHSAKYENALSQFKEQFARIYGEPDKADEFMQKWYLDEGSTFLYVSSLWVYANQYYICVMTKRVN